MTELRIRLDPLNPGQFFGCCGILELITLEESDALAWFEVDPSQPRSAEFVVPNSLSLQDVLTQLRSAKPEFPNEEVEASVRPAVIPYNGDHLVLDWWLDEFRNKPVNLKCWAGQVTTKNLFSELLPLLGDDNAELFERARMTKSKFGVDPRSAWNTLDFGFSPNEHGTDATTFPAVEILAAIGLQGFRPNAERRRGLFYGLWQEPLPAAVARVAFRSPWSGLPRREYAFSIAKRGQSYKYFTFAEELDKETKQQ